MQIKIVIFDNIHYINFMLNLSIFFHYNIFLMSSVQIGLRLIHPCVTCAI